MPILHDGQDHVARIANFYAALKEGILVPRWAASLNWGYGHPILMFLYPLPEYMASAFHFVGFTLVDSTKLVFGLAFISSAATMFLWMSSAFGIEAGIIAALLYAFAPYRFVDLHVRGALGEHVAFIFPPLCFYYVWKLSRTKSVRGAYLAALGAAFSIAALILSHNAIALMFLPIIGLYGLYLLIAEVKHRWLYSVAGAASVALGFALSAFFWLPALLEGKFTLRDIVTAGGALTRFVPWSWFVYSPWNYGGTDTLTKSLGYPQWVGIVGAVLLLLKVKQKKLRALFIGLFIVLLTSFFIQTRSSAPIWIVSKILQDFQFPWRFLSVSVFVAAVLGGLSFPRIIDWLFRKMKIKRETLFIISCLLIITATWYMWYPKGYQVHDDSFYSGIYGGTTDTGESSPIWFVRFMEHPPDNPLDVVDGDATVTVGKRTTTMHEYTITARKPTLMLENTLYFPGWMIYLNGLPTGIEWQNPTYRGIMTFRVTPGVNQSVRVAFGDTRTRTIGNRVSMLAFAFVLLTGIGGLLWQKRK